MLENSGSIARDILATERTFLAWSRTGLGFVGAGSALFAAYHREANTSDDTSLTSTSTLNHSQNYRLIRDIIPACALLMANGAFLLLFATRRYLRVVAALQRNQFLVDTRGTLAAVAFTATSTLASLGLIAYAEIRQKNNPKP